jgi:hypothetical protein
LHLLARPHPTGYSLEALDIIIHERHRERGIQAVS